MYPFTEGKDPDWSVNAPERCYDVREELARVTPYDIIRDHPARAKMLREAGHGEAERQRKTEMEEEQRRAAAEMQRAVDAAAAAALVSDDKSLDIVSVDEESGGIHV
jgi:hypothetical protein